MSKDLKTMKACDLGALIERLKCGTWEYEAAFEEWRNRTARENAALQAELKRLAAETQAAELRIEKDKLAIRGIRQLTTSETHHDKK